MVNAPGADSFWFIGAIVVGLALLGVGAVALNAWRASRWRDNVTASMADRKYSAADAEKLLALVREPHGARGLTRGLIALLVVVLAALALAATMISAAPDALDLRKTIVTSLLAVLATIAGFYYGSRTAQTSASDAAVGSATTASARPPEPVITALRDNKGKSGSPIEIIGSGLSATTVILFGTVPGEALVMNNDSSVTVTPPMQSQGISSVMVVAITPTDRSAAGPQANFKYE